MLAPRTTPFAACKSRLICTVGIKDETFKPSQETTQLNFPLVLNNIWCTGPFVFLLLCGEQLQVPAYISVFFSACLHDDAWSPTYLICLHLYPQVQNSSLSLNQTVAAFFVFRVGDCGLPISLLWHQVCQHTCTGGCVFCSC